MTNSPDALWLGVNPSLKHFDNRLCRLLDRHTDIRYWGYYQTADEPCCLETALALLDDYIVQQSQPIHLLGHGLSGTIGLLYTRLHPNRVKSLTLISVGASPSICWHAQYYALRNLLSCDRQMILMQMANALFGCRHSAKLSGLAKLLEKVLDSELAPHSVAKYRSIDPGGVDVPLLVCRGADDAVVDPNAHAHWQSWVQVGDRLWTCPGGRHFFHHTHASETSSVILDFWQQAVAIGDGSPLIEITT